ncbi:MAG: J domain-containing protein [Oscillospiraceae bacterium]
MKTILTILKINALSLISFPILLISIIAKLLQKAVEKTVVFLGVGVTLLVLYLLNMFLNNPNNIFENIATIIAVLLVFGAIIFIVFSILFFFGSIATAVITVITSLLISIFECVFQLSHEAYSKLYDVCKSDFENLKQSNTNSKVHLSCIFWYILVGFNKIIVTLFSLAFPISLVAAVIFGGYSVFYVNSYISKLFGISTFKYLELFPTTNTVFTILYFVIVVFSVMIVIISLGLEWNEWGSTLKCATQDYQQYKAIMLNKASVLDHAADSSYSFTAGKNLQKCEEAMESLKELFDNIEFVHQQVDAAINVKKDSSLSYDFATYIQLLEEINNELEKQNAEIPCDYFEKKLIPMIELAKKQAKSIEKDAFAILNVQAKNANKKNQSIDFFGGCETTEEIKKRYKSLCKVYHPDVGGHEETFKQLQNQYEMQMAATEPIL